MSIQNFFIVITDWMKILFQNQIQQMTSMERTRCCWKNVMIQKRTEDALVTEQTNVLVSIYINFLETVDTQGV